jgi:DNA-binding CsgD family transcriptional regulator
VESKREHIHQMWDELADFQAADWEPALRHLLERVVQLIGASNAGWLGAVRLLPDAHDDLLRGWRPRGSVLLHPTEVIETSVRTMTKRLDRAKPDVTTMRVMQRTGSFRVLRLRDLVDESWFESDFYREYYESTGMCDAMYTIIPVNEHAESLVSLFRDRSLPAFSAEDVEAASYALRGTRWFHQRVLLSQGLVLAKSPLTSTETRVVRELLQGDIERAVSIKLGLSYHSAREHIANIYKKFGINSRAELMALWLGKRAESSVHEASKS